MRPAAELLAVWRHGDPGRRRYVCRPSLQRPEVPSCFREVVGPASLHAIALAERPAVDYAAGGIIEHRTFRLADVVHPGERFVFPDGRVQVVA